MKTLIALLFVGGLAAQTPPMIPMATGGGPVGGATNLTTVGSVPYVSASGTLDQDAGQFSWDVIGHKLGIRTTTPATSLQIGNYTVGTDEKITVAAGSGYTSALRLYDASTAYGFTIQNNPVSAYLEFLRHNNSVPGVSAMVISRTAGNVGIGTTGPAARLDVVDIAYGLRVKGGDGGTGTIIANFVDSASVSKVYIRGDGNVGIGTTSPGFALQVNGGANNGSKNTVSIFGRPDNTTRVEVGTGDGTNNSGFVGSASNHPFFFTTNSTEKMRIDTAGNVGIGTTTPGSALSVNGRASANLFGSETNCSSSAGPAVCAAAAAGSVVVAAAASTVVVNSTAVTANSQIFVVYDSSLGTKLGVTCNATIPALYGVTARTAATSFTLTATAPVTNPACFSYFIVN